MKVIKSNKKYHKKAIVALFIFLVLVALVCSAYVYIFNGNLFGWSAGNNNGDTKIIDEVNYGPPTTQEINDGQSAKKAIINKTQTNNSNDTGSKQRIEVGIANAYKSDTDLEIRAFMPEIIEGNGKCMATLTKSTTKVTRTTEAFIDSTTTICRPLLIPLSQFPEKGVWKLVVTYSSSKYYGTSSPSEVEI